MVEALSQRRSLTAETLVQDQARRSGTLAHKVEARQVSL